MLKWDRHLRSELPSYDLVVPALLEKGVKDVREACFLTPGEQIR